MSTLDDLVEAGKGFLSDPKAIEGMIDAALTLLDDKEPTLVRAGLTFARGYAEKIAHVAPKALVGLTGKFLSHGETIALEDYLRNIATADEIREATEAARKGAAKEAAHSAWVDDIMPVLKALAPALPFILAVI